MHACMHERIDHISSTEAYVQHLVLRKWVCNVSYAAEVKQEARGISLYSML